MSRLTDNDRQFGPITYARCSPSWRPLRLVYSSGANEDGPGPNTLTAYAFGWVARLPLPRLLEDYRVRHFAASWDAATVERLGRNWYEERFPREYGFSLSDGFLQLFLGAQTHDSTTTQDWCAHLPWTQWRHVRQSWYGPTGQHIETLWDTNSREVREAQFEWRREFEATLAKVKFQIADFDGAIITVATNIEEREWRFGTGLFRWLSIFRKPKISRSLDIEFATECGPEKGSWKGGLIGTSIAMLPGELHEAALRRYCEQDHRGKYQAYRVTFVGRADCAGP